MRRRLAVALGIVAAAAIIGFQALPFVAYVLGEELPERIEGEVSVIDGDTLRIDNLVIRLWGIDAPEDDQHCELPDGEPWPCGAEASKALEAMIDGRSVVCAPLYFDRYRRVVARCWRNDAELGAWLVRRGWALDWPRYSDGHYADDQAIARARRAGVWRGTFVLPWDWRWEE